MNALRQAALRPLYDGIVERVDALHGRWKLFIELYARGKAQVAVLNSAAPAFFAFVKETLSSRVMLDIAQLLDPMRSGGRDNLVLQRLVDETRSVLPPEASRRADECLLAARAAHRNIRVVRNKRIAHADLLVMLKATSTPKVTIVDVNKVLGSIAEAVNLVGEHVFEVSHAFDALVIVGGAPELVAVLEDGLAARANKRGHCHEV